MDEQTPPRAPACADIDALSTSYVDEEMADADRRRVAQHLAMCPPCARRVEMEKTARGWLRSGAHTFTRASAPSDLRTRVAASIAPPPARINHGRRFAALAAAAALVLVMGGVAIALLTSRSTTVLAAELTLDHLKCARLGLPVEHGADPVALCNDFRTRFGWDVRLPSAPGIDGLELVGGRRCLAGDGQIAHIVYRLHGRAVSLFMQPNAVHDADDVKVFGYEHLVWAARGATYILTGDVARADLERIARAVQAESGLQ